MDQIELERLEEMEERLGEMMGISTRVMAMSVGQRDSAELLELLAESIAIQQEMLAWMVGIESARLRGGETGPGAGNVT